VAKKYLLFLAIEPVNRFESYFLNTAEDAKKLIREIGHPNIKTFGHFPDEHRRR